MTYESSNHFGNEHGLTRVLRVMSETEDEYDSNPTNNVARLR